MLRGESDAAERRPLLTYRDLNLEGLAARAPEAERGEEKFLEWENRPWYMVGFNMCMAMVNVSTILGAYFFLRSVGNRITPRCYVFKDEKLGLTDLPDDPNDEHWNGMLCDLCTFCFWTYPLVCPMAVVWVYSKNLLDARLYYECLMHGVILDLRNSSYLFSPLAWLLFLHGSLAVAAVHFIRISSDLAKIGDEPLAFGLLAYFLPVFAFLVVALCHWSVKWYTVPVGKFVENDHKGGIKLLDRCTFIEETNFRDAFEAITETLDEAPVPVVPLKTPEWLRLIAEAASRRVSRPSRWCGGDCRAYWVYRLLFSKYLKDGRAREFRLWSTLYGIFLFVCFILFLVSFLITAVDVMHFERVMPGDVLPDLERRLSSTAENSLSGAQEFMSTPAPGRESAKFF